MSKMNCFRSAIAALCAATSLVVAACDANTKEDANADQGHVSVTGEILRADATRTQIDTEPTDDGSVGILWSAGDRIGVFGDRTDNAEFKGTFTQAVASGQFSGVMASGDSPKYAYYPYVEGAESLQSIPVTVAAEQTYSKGSSIAANDVKASVSPAKSGDGTFKFTFTPMVALLRITVQFDGLEGIGETERLTGVILTDKTEERHWTGAFTMNLDDLASGLTPADASGAKSYVRVNLPGTDGSGKLLKGRTVAYAAISPDVKAGDIIEVRILTDQHTIRFEVTAEKDFSAGMCYDIPLDISRLTPENNLMVFEPAAESPELRSFGFEVALNQGKILGHEAYYEGSGTETTVHTVERKDFDVDQTTGAVDCFIPYLYDFNLIPTFTTSKGAVVTVNGQVQTSGESAQDFSSPEPVIYSVTNGETTKEYKVSVSNTGLPVVVLEIEEPTEKDEQYGRLLDYLDITSKAGAFPENDRITIYEGKGQTSLATGLCGVRLRGNSSRKMPKKPVNIKLKEKTNVLGMKTHKRWCLIASQYDKTMMRNAFTYSLANDVQDHFTGEVGTELGKGLVYNPHGQSVEVVMNGLHVGTYYLCEHIKQGGKRLDILDCYDDVLEKTSKETPSREPYMKECGFLMEMSTDEDPIHFRTSRRNLPVTVKDADNIEGTKLLDSLQTYFNTFEDYIYSGYAAESNSATERTYYDKAYEMIDINSMIDWWIINELAMNDEMQWPKSVYVYKNGNGKVFAGPVWDFDWQTYVNIEAYNASSLIKQMENLKGYEPHPYKFTADGYSSIMFNRGKTTGRPYLWFPLLFKDPVFVARVKARWNSLYGSVLQSQALKISQMGKERELAAESNWKIWNIRNPHQGNCGDEYDMTYSEAIQSLRDVFEKRREGLNTVINNL